MKTSVHIDCIAHYISFADWVIISVATSTVWRTYLPCENMVSDWTVWLNLRLFGPMVNLNLRGAAAWMLQTLKSSEIWEIERWVSVDSYLPSAHGRTPSVFLTVGCPNDRWPVRNFLSRCMEIGVLVGLKRSMRKKFFT